MGWHEHDKNNTERYGENGRGEGKYIAIIFSALFLVCIILSISTYLNKNGHPSNTDIASKGVVTPVLENTYIVCLYQELILHKSWLAKDLHNLTGYLSFEEVGSKSKTYIINSDSLIIISKLSECPNLEVPKT